MVSFDEVKKRLMLVRPGKWKVYGDNLEARFKSFRFSLCKLVDPNPGGPEITDYRLEVYKGESITPLVSFGKRGDDNYVRDIYNMIRRKVEKNEEKKERESVRELEKVL